MKMSDMIECKHESQRSIITYLGTPDIDIHHCRKCDAFWREFSPVKEDEKEQIRRIGS